MDNMAEEATPTGTTPPPTPRHSTARAWPEQLSMRAATPAPRNSAESAIATPDSTGRMPLSSSASNTGANDLPNTPFGPGTPCTPPSSTRVACTDDGSLFHSSVVPTGKCTECDRRNPSVMRQCPGCAFKLCTPCFDKRPKEGLERKILHGFAMSKSASPATPRAVRKKPRDSFGVSETQMGGLGKEGADGEGKTKVKAKSRLDPTSRKRAVKRPKKTAKFVESEEDEDRSSKEYDPEDDDTFLPSKRPRSTLTMAGPSCEFPQQEPSPRKRLLASSSAAYQTPSSPTPNFVTDPLATTRVPGSSMSIDELMRSHGVNTYQNPYQEHLISRNILVVSNPEIMIPSKVARKFEKLPTAAQIQQNIQEKTESKFQEKRIRNASAVAQESSIPYLQDRRQAAPPGTKACTVRDFVEMEAVKYRDEVTMDEDENKALAGHLEAEALSWGTRTWRGLPDHRKNVMRPGLNLRLDLLDEPPVSMSRLAGLLKEEAEKKLQRMQEDRAY